MGGGLSGLSLAWFLRKRFKEAICITIVEQSFRTGGLIESQEQAGFLFEQGPHSIRAKGPGAETLQLVQELGLEDQVIAADKSSGVRFRWIDQKLQPLPSGLIGLLFSPLAKELLPALWKEWRIPAHRGQEETIYAFVSRRFGTALAERFFDPMVAGIYAGEMRSLSMRACFPLLHHYEQQYGSVVKGAIFSQWNHRRPPRSDFVAQVQAAGAFSFKSGMETLTRSLSQKSCAHVLLGARVVGLHPQGQHQGINIALADGRSLHADRVFSALPANALGAAVTGVDLPAAQLLQSLHSASVAVVNLGYHRDVLPGKGFGYLIPAKEKEEILGVIWDSSIFPQQQSCPTHTRLAVMMGGERHPDMAGKGEDALAGIAMKAVAKHMKIVAAPDALMVKVAHAAIPQYALGHQGKVEAVKHALKRELPQLHLCGNWLSGVSVNDCIAYSKQTAATL